MKAVYAGSFDPVTLGHMDIIKRASEAFELYVVVANNASKKHMFTLEERRNLLHRSLLDEDLMGKYGNGIEIVIMMEGLLANTCMNIGATHVIRGLRNTVDFEYELNMARVNKVVGGLETVFFISQPDRVHVSSSIVRELVKNKVEPKTFVTPRVNEFMKERFNIYDDYD